MIYHADLGLSGGYVGVDVFFVISGYVITRMLTVELSSDGRIGLGRFYLRRIRRLLPALGVMLTFVLLASGLLASLGGQQVTARTGASAAVFNANTYLIRAGGAGYFDVDANVNALLHTWSLSVEEQFYFVFPAILFGAWIFGRKMSRVGSRSAAVAALLVISVLSFLLSWIMATGRLSFWIFSSFFAFYSSLTRAWEFAAGALLALVSRRLTNLRPMLSWLLVAVGVALVGYAAFRFDDQTPFPGTAALFPVVGALCVLAAGGGRSRNLVSRGLALRPAQFLGDLSYSWYLWHWPFIVFAVALWPTTNNIAVAAAAISLAPAWLSYRFVESPIRFAPRATTRRTLALASACIMLPIMAAVALVGANRVLTETDSISEYNYAMRLHADVIEGCDNEEPLGDRDQPECTWRAEGSSREAVLIGDSNAGQFTEAFVDAAIGHGTDATVATNRGCPFVDLVIVQDGNQNDSDLCRSFVQGSIEDLIQSRPNLVVIASASDLYIRDPVFELRDPSDGEWSRTADSKAEVWADGLARVIEPLVAQGIEVVVIHPIPKFYGWDPRKCAAVHVLVESQVCAPTAALDTIDQYRNLAIAAESSAAGSTGVTTLDVSDIICPSGICATNRQGQWVWRDGLHITVQASTQLAPRFGGLF